jgi:hypothetical protein
LGLVTYWLVLVAYVVAVALKAYQQRNVQYAEYKAMPAISYGMAICEVFMVSTIARADNFYELALLTVAMGTGSSLGSILGTWLHARKH